MNVLLLRSEELKLRSRGWGSSPAAASSVCYLCVSRRRWLPHSLCAICVSHVAVGRRRPRAITPDIEDKHIWCFSSSGQYSTKTAYEGFFLGATIFRPWEKIWKTWAPSKCSFFMWLVAHDRCWTADHLERRGLPHAENCPMCDQAPVSINHLLVGCAFAREFWFHFFSFHK